MATSFEHKTWYVCLEGVDGVGKTTQCRALSNCFQEEGYTVLVTKEPGSPHLPLTMTLRDIMLSKDYDDQLSMSGREYISQAIRSIHIEKLITPTIVSKKYDLIFQDRGLLSGLAYGEACGNEESTLKFLMNNTRGKSHKYDLVIVFTGDVKACLEKAQQSKQEFSKGDVIESRGTIFMKKVEENMRRDVDLVSFKHAFIDITGKTIPQVTEEVAKIIKKCMSH